MEYNVQCKLSYLYLSKESKLVAFADDVAVIISSKHTEKLSEIFDEGNSII